MKEQLNRSIEKEQKLEKSVENHQMLAIKIKRLKSTLDLNDDYNVVGSNEHKKNNTPAVRSFGESEICEILFKGNTGHIKSVGEILDKLRKIMSDNEEHNMLKEKLRSLLKMKFGTVPEILSKLSEVTNGTFEEVILSMKMAI